MKKSVEAPQRPVQEKNPKKSSSSNSEWEKTTSFRKPVEPVTNTIRPTRPNAHEPVDDELTIPGLPDKEAGKYTPLQDPW